MTAQLFKYEAGELDHEETVELFQNLIDGGHCWRLQGQYGRVADAMIQSGLCMLPPEPQTDYWGNPIPGRHDVVPGTVGSEEFVNKTKENATDA